MANPFVIARQTVSHKGKPEQRHELRHYYQCPGCDTIHGIRIKLDVQENGAGWDFCGTLTKPTYSPSQLTTWSKPAPHGDRTIKFVCHTFIREGLIQYLDDCTHALKGQTVPLPPLPDWIVAEEEERVHNSPEA